MAYTLKYKGEIQHVLGSYNGYIDMANMHDVIVKFIHSSCTQLTCSHICNHRNAEDCAKTAQDLVKKVDMRGRMNESNESEPFGSGNISLYAASPAAKLCSLQLAV